MSSMYATIMHLPLFKGVTVDDVSAFLEKACIEFERYQAGDVIISKGAVFDRLGFVISGKVRVSTGMDGDNIVISQTLGKGYWLLPEFLFGLVRESDSDVISENECCILWLPKEQLQELLSRNSICQLNFLNYLCYKAQGRRQSTMMPFSGSIFERWLNHVLTCTTERRAQNICISVDLTDLAERLSISERELISQLQHFSRRNKVTYLNGTLLIHNRRDYF